MRQRKSQNKTEAAAKETHFMARTDFFKGLVTPHNAYCQTRSNTHLVVSTLDVVNVPSLLLRQKTL